MKFWKFSLILLAAFFTALFLIFLLPGYFADGGSLADTVPNIIIILVLLYLLVDMLIKSEARYTLVHYSIVYMAALWVMFFLMVALLNLIAGELEGVGFAALYAIVALWPWNGIYNFYDGLHIKAVANKFIRSGRTTDLEEWVALIQEERQKN